MGAEVGDGAGEPVYAGAGLSQPKNKSFEVKSYKAGKGAGFLRVIVKRLKMNVWPAIAAVAALGVMQGWKFTLPDAASGAPFLSHIREEFKDFPHDAGDWRGTDIALPKEAIALLRPNLFVSRSYVNSRTGDEAELLFIEVEDSRDMMGHYPPNCYPGNGWELKHQQPGTWKIGDAANALSIPGVEYAFTRQIGGEENNLTVRDFFILPDGKFYPDISTFGRAASDFRIRPLGATQVQVVFNREYLPADRDRIFDSLMTAHRELLDAVFNGRTTQ